MLKSLYLLAASVAILTSCFTMSTKSVAADTKPDYLSAQSFATTLELKYLLFLPKGCEVGGAKRWPLIMFLHGAGERGDDVWRTSIHGPTKYIKTHPDFPFILVSPLCPAGEKWSDDVLLRLLDSITNNYPVDTKRIYLTGLSMGGYGTWSLATTHPERFAAIAPICGGEGNIGVVLSKLDATRAPLLKKLPIWAFHGGKDPTVSVHESERMIDIFKKAGDEDVKLTIYPDALHDSWSATYANPELYDWFLKHQLK